MKRFVPVMIIGFVLLAGCANPGRYNTQRGAAIGAGVGAVGGGLIGRSTEAALIGTGVGTVLGGLLGNLEDQHAAEARDAYYESRMAEMEASRDAYQPAPEVHEERTIVYVTPDPEPPPGRWVKVPGRWVGNRWVPPHMEWRPIHPDRHRHNRPY